MKKTLRAIALLLCAMLVLTFFGCSLVEVDDSVDESQAVATVNGVDITYADYMSVHDYYIALYQQYGYDITSNADYYTQYISDVLESLINEEVLRQKAEDLGFTNLSAEDLSEVNSDFLTQYAEFKETFREQAESDHTNDATVDVDARMEELARASLEENGSSYDETYYTLFVVPKAIENLEASIEDTVTITDDDVKSYYDDQLAAQKEAIDADPTAYESYAEGYEDAPALYAPEGYRYVTHILVKFEGKDTDADSRITEIETRQTEISDRLSEIETETSALDTTASDYQTSLDALNTEKDELNTENDSLTTEYNQLIDKRKAACYALAQDVVAQLDAGKSWDELATQYNEDTGTQEDGAYYTTGYLVGPKSSSYEQNFTDAAVALANVGEYSKTPVETSYGYHILMLKSVVTAGEVPYDTVKDTLHDLVLTNKKSDVWGQQQEDWVAAATVERFEDRLPTVSPSSTATED